MSCQKTQLFGVATLQFTWGVSFRPRDQIGTTRSTPPAPRAKQKACERKGVVLEWRALCLTLRVEDSLNLLFGVLRVYSLYAPCSGLLSPLLPASALSRRLVLRAALLV